MGILAETTKAEKPKADVEIEQGNHTIIAQIPWTYPQLLWHSLSVRLVASEKVLKKDIEDLLKDIIWG